MPTLLLTVILHDVVSLSSKCSSRQSVFVECVPVCNNKHGCTFSFDFITARNIH